MNTTALCQYLAWDSDFFGYRIARLTVNQLNPQLAEQAIQWCKSNAIDCLYFLAEADDQATVKMAETYQFHFVDIRLTLERHIDSLLNTQSNVRVAGVRPVKLDDIPALRAIAGNSYHNTRFYHDSHISKSLCDALYETWIEKSCNGYADRVFVAELQGQLVGYISCNMVDQFEGQIGLVGVGPDAQGKGIGSNLVNSALIWFAEQGAKQAGVVTQGRNVQGQRLYQRAGFITKSVQLWYHHWFSPGQTDISK